MQEETEANKVGVTCPELHTDIIRDALPEFRSLYPLSLAQVQTMALQPTQ